MQPTNVLFVCLGNICRSPMAEAMFTQLVADHDLSDDYVITSAATSTEEVGNPPHPGALAALRHHHLDASDHRAHQITQPDCQNADYIITMDTANLAAVQRLLPASERSKVHLCMDIVPGKQGVSIADPWYTHKFETTYEMLNTALPLWLTTMQQSRQEASV
ncbi:low molecular weight protein-tyrosine-phosphatase [Fructilactobacillus myrtifloralis]|nr:low molecular weight protein-tyrosine-phosphatase [Fructilactobacillus myrtifloralis]